MTPEKLLQQYQLGNIGPKDFAKKVVSLITAANVREVMKRVPPPALADIRAETYRAPTEESEWNVKVTSVHFDPSAGDFGQEVREVISAWPKKYRDGVNAVRGFFAKC